VYCPLPADDPKQRRPDISKAHELLDWGPTVPVREGLARTIESFGCVLERGSTTELCACRKYI
jgi:UDP-glucuronate decarboxylase